MLKLHLHNKTSFSLLYVRTHNNTRAYAHLYRENTKSQLELKTAANLSNYTVTRKKQTYTNAMLHIVALQNMLHNATFHMVRVSTVGAYANPFSGQVYRLKCAKPTHPAQHSHLKVTIVLIQCLLS